MYNIGIHNERTLTRKMSAHCKKHIGDTYVGKKFWGGHIYGQLADCVCLMFIMKQVKGRNGIILENVDL